MEKYTIPASDGEKIRVRLHRAQNPRGRMLVIHGMAEHAARYDGFAAFAAESGFDAHSIELRGHGEGAVKLGWFAKRDGWRLVTDDCMRVLRYMAGTNPPLPLFLFGHSMGTVFARCVLMHAEAPEIAAAALSGVTVDVPVRRLFAPFMTRVVGLFTGDDIPSKFLDKLTFSKFNGAFPSPRTDFDWLTRDTALVDSYVADPLCGFLSTPSMMRDVSTAILHTLKPKNAAGIRSPVHILVGRNDPVGGKRAAGEIERAWKRLGKRVSVTVYEGARHALLDETNREDVRRDIISYFLRYL